MAEIVNKKVFDDVEENELFNLKKIWALVLINWYWVLLSVVICLCVSRVYLRYTSPVYSASMKILVKESDKKNSAFRGMNMSLGEMGLMSNSDAFDNELEILRSAALSSDVVNRLKLEKGIKRIISEI